jgi:hypothetical protein
MVHLGESVTYTFLFCLQLKITYINSLCTFEAMDIIIGTNTRATKIVDKFASLNVVACLLLLNLMSINITMHVEF